MPVYKPARATRRMGAERTVLLAGLAMLASGLAMFYAVGSGPGPVRDAGTFVGIGGIGVALAGALLYLTGRAGPPTSGPGA